MSSLIGERIEVRGINPGDHPHPLCLPAGRQPSPASGRGRVLIFII